MAFNKIFIFTVVFAVMAIVYTNCAPAETENREDAEDDEQTDQTFYAIFSTCTNNTDCASRLIYKTCRRWPIVGYKCSLF